MIFERRVTKLLGTRELQFISLISFNDGIKTSDIQSKLGLSKRQIGYTCKKINDFLKENHISPIERQSKGTYLILQDTRKYFLKHLLTSKKTIFEERTDDANIQQYYDGQLRQGLLFLLLTTKGYHLTTLMSFLNISQNTVLSDIKLLQDKIEQYGLTISHSRLAGYLVNGDEKIVLLMQLKVIDLIKQKNEGFDLIHFVGDSPEQVISLIQAAEKKLQVKYSDDSFVSLQEYVYFFLLRLKNRDYKEYFFDNRIQQTMEFRYLNQVLEKISIQDKQWLSLLFLSANILQNNNKRTDDEIYQASLSFVEQFEKNTFMRISEKENFVKRLYSHVRPLVFRTLYDLPLLGIDLRNYFKDDQEKMSYLFKAIKKSIYPLEKLIGKKISDDEIKLISFYFGAELSFGISQSTSLKKRALVICSNGLVTAKIMKDNLTSLFPEINFVKTGSVREFVTDNSGYDLVFTTVPLNTEKMQYVIDPVMEKGQEANLRNKVLLDLGLESSDKKLEQIVQIIERNAEVKNIGQLKKELNTFMSVSPGRVAHLETENEYNILDFVKPEYISFTDGNISWEKALRQAARPLILNDVVNEMYVNELVNQISSPNSYSFLKGVIAIPHAIPKMGASSNGFGFLISRKPIEFPGHPNVSIIVPIAITGQRNYMGAINQLMSLAGNDVLLRRLSHTNSIDIVTKLLKNLK